MNYWHMKEYDSFKDVFLGIRQKITKNEPFQIIHRVKNFAAHFHTGHNFRPHIFNITCRFRILDIQSFLKSMVKYSYGGGGGGGGVI